MSRAKPLVDGDAPLVVYVAGVAWDGIEGTDHRLVEHLTQHLPVLWVDPPRPLTRRLRPHAAVVEPPAGLRRLQENLWHLHVVVTPGVSRPLLRDVAAHHHLAAIRCACRRMGARRLVALLAHPMGSLAAMPADQRIYLVTDDFIEGAGILGLSRDRARRLSEANVAAADTVLAISPVLVERLGGPSAKIRLFPNGCAPERFSGPLTPRPLSIPGPVAGIVGQLNERLDVDLLLDLTRAGVSLLLVGPRYEQDVTTRRQLNDLIAQPSVEWVGRQPFSAVPEYLAAIDLGLTPYVDNEFNRASFPLKTLEYLSAGLRVVSTDLPSARWLNSSMVDIVPTPSAFVGSVRARLREGRSAESSRACREVAAGHSWASRAEELVRIIAGKSLAGHT